MHEIIEIGYKKVNSNILTKKQKNILFHFVYENSCLGDNGECKRVSIPKGLASVDPHLNLTDKRLFSWVIWLSKCTFIWGILESPLSVAERTRTAQPWWYPRRELGACSHGLSAQGLEIGILNHPCYCLHFSFLEPKGWGMFMSMSLSFAHLSRSLIYSSVFIFSLSPLTS